MHLAKRLRVRTLLVLIVLIPTTGMVGLATSAATQSWSSRQVAIGIRTDARHMLALMDARAAVMAESIPSSALTLAAGYGLTADRLLELNGVDYAADLVTARTHLDGDHLLATDPVLAEDMRALGVLRPRMDRGEASYDEVRALFKALGLGIDAQYLDARARLDAAMAHSAVHGIVRSRRAALRGAYDAFLAGNLRITSANDLSSDAAGPASARSLIDADARLSTAISAVRGNLGPRAADAFRALRRDPGAGRFELVVAQVIDETLTGTPSVLATDVLAYASAFSDGATWLAGMTAVVGAASADLGAAATAQAAADTQAFRREVLVVVLIVLASLVGVVVLARSMARPLRRIAGVMRAVREGTFDLPTLHADGPRELAETAIAINDMAMTLGAVEARAVALAEDRDDDLGAPLPGRTGQALQTALDRLHEAATHDGLTGLLNRSAALDAVGRELARAERDGESVLLLFVDLDGLKVINDTHGHHVGDAAIRLAADALRTACRDADIVARLGGDEFILAGATRGTRGEVEVLAERVRDEVSRSVLRTGGVEIPLRCSVGMAIGRSADASVESLIAEADAAMYRAKAGGRGRVAWLQVA